MWGKFGHGVGRQPIDQCRCRSVVNAAEYLIAARAAVAYGHLWVAHKGSREPRITGGAGPLDLLWATGCGYPRVGLVMHASNCSAGTSWYTPSWGPRLNK